MREDMAMRGLRSHTQRDYTRIAKSSAIFLGAVTQHAATNDVRRF
ncbi:hypothetical protein [Acidocella sp.]|nr:hypothetical protein [Acidocella sp.]